jgi:hypothetical protein
MFSGGMFQSIPGLRDALTKPEAMQDWLEAAQDRGQRRMHSTDTASLQVEVERLRLYVETLFRLLVARGVFTAEEAQRLVGELEAAASASDGAAKRDVVSGAELPPEENPFRELRGAGGTRRRVRWVWRAWVRFLVAAAGVLAAVALACVIVWGWLR